MESTTGTDLGGALRTDGTGPVGGGPVGGAAVPGGPLRTVPPQRRRSGPRPVPAVSEAYAHLSIESLRAYRRALTEEENKVSYWRRLLQGRHDVVAGGGSGATAQQARLGTMLTSERVGAGRSVLAQIVPAAVMPPLPELDELWQRELDPSDEPARAALLADLEAAEAQVSSYRTALHARIAEATGELIARYRAEPTLCLSALPFPHTA